MIACRHQTSCFLFDHTRRTPYIPTPKLVMEDNLAYVATSGEGGFGTSASALSSTRHLLSQFGISTKTSTSLVRVSKLPKGKVQSLLFRLAGKEVRLDLNCLSLTASHGPNAWLLPEPPTLPFRYDLLNRVALEIRSLIVCRASFATVELVSYDLGWKDTCTCN